MPRASSSPSSTSSAADFDAALAACQDAFGDGVLPLYLPVTRRGLIGLLSQQCYDYAPAPAPSATPTRRPDRLEERAAPSSRESSQESEDETLMDRYLAGEHLDAKMLIADLEKAVARGSLLPGARHVVPHGDSSALGASSSSS